MNWQNLALAAGVVLSATVLLVLLLVGDAQRWSFERFGGLPLYISAVAFSATAILAMGKMRD